MFLRHHQNESQRKDLYNEFSVPYKQRHSAPQLHEEERKKPHQSLRLHLRLLKANQKKSQKNWDKSLLCAVLRSLSRKEPIYQFLNALKEA
jgi:hypothetical protein